MDNKDKILFDRYNIDNIIKRTVLQCIADFPEDTYDEICKKLGVNIRTFHRWIRQYDVPMKKQYGIKTETAIKKLEKLGYKIEKPNS